MKSNQRNDSSRSFLVNLMSLVDTMMETTLETLKLFEKDCLNTYLKQKCDSENQQIDKRIQVIEEKWVNVANLNF